MLKSTPRIVLLSVALAILLGIQAFHAASGSAARSLHDALTPTLAGQLEAAFRYQLDTGANNLVIDTINRDLTTVDTGGPLPLLRQCTATLEQLRSQPLVNGTTIRGNDWSGSRHTLLLEWQHGGAPARARIAMRCEPRIAALVASSTGMALLLSALLFWLPGQWQRRVPWWTRAMRQHPGRPLAAVRAAMASDLVVLDPDACHVIIHGVPITLPRTPFLYYLWYARRRLAGGQHEGWYLNPPVNRPDRRVADEVRLLMEAHGGNTKAINDLSRQGLRARVLDQNRNRVKEELVAALGERLATPWLFESRRDPVSQRHAYRLIASPARIRIAGQASAGLPDDGFDVPSTE